MNHICDLFFHKDCHSGCSITRPHTKDLQLKERSSASRRATGKRLVVESRTPTKTKKMKTKTQTKNDFLKDQESEIVSSSSCSSTETHGFYCQGFTEEGTLQGSALYPYSNKCLCQSTDHARKCVKCMAQTYCVASNMYKDTRHPDFMQPLRIHIDSKTCSLSLTDPNKGVVTPNMAHLTKALIEAIVGRSKTGWEEEEIFHLSEFGARLASEEDLLQLSWILTRRKVSFRSFLDGQDAAIVVNMFETFPSLLEPGPESFDSIFIDEDPHHEGRAPSPFKFTMEDMQEFDI